MQILWRCVWDPKITLEKSGRSWVSTAIHLGLEFAILMENTMWFLYPHKLVFLNGTCSKYPKKIQVWLGKSSINVGYSYSEYTCGFCWVTDCLAFSAWEWKSLLGIWFIFWWLLDHKARWSSWNLLTLHFMNLRLGSAAYGSFVGDLFCPEKARIILPPSKKVGLWYLRCYWQLLATSGN